MPFSKIVPLSAVKNDYDLVLFDLWGVFFKGDGKIYEGTIETVNDLMKSHKVAFVSNSPRLSHEVALHMRGFGVECMEDHMFTSGQIAHKLLHANDVIESPVMYHLSTANYPKAHNFGISMADELENANVMLLTCQLDEGDDLEVFNPILKRAADLGIICVCSNPDEKIQNNGRLRYCPGYFAGIYKRMGGKVVYTGKPGEDLFLEAIVANGSPKLNRVLMIGDTLETDILGANRVGIDSGLVLTGNIEKVIYGAGSHGEKLSKIHGFCKESNIKPTMIIDLVS